MAVLPPAPQRTVALTTGLHQRETSVGSPSYSTASTSPTSNGPCSNRPSAREDAGRPLRRAKRRWKIERLFAWLHNCRRVVTRWERHVGNYLGMVQLACARILLRAFMR